MLNNNFRPRPRRMNSIRQRMAPQPDSRNRIGNAPRPTDLRSPMAQQFGNKGGMQGSSPFQATRAPGVQPGTESPGRQPPGIFPFPPSRTVPPGVEPGTGNNGPQPPGIFPFPPAPPPSRITPPGIGPGTGDYGPQPPGLFPLPPNLPGQPPPPTPPIGGNPFEQALAEFLKSKGNMKFDANFKEQLNNLLYQVNPQYDALQAALQQMQGLYDLDLARFGTDQAFNHDKVNQNAAARGLYDSGIQQYNNNEVVHNYDRMRQDRTFGHAENVANNQGTLAQMLSGFQQNLSDMYKDYLYEQAQNPNTSGASSKKKKKKVGGKNK